MTVTMAMTDAMDETDYSSVDFNQVNDGPHNFDSYDASLRRHPPWLTQGHFVYHLVREADDKLGFVKDRHGEPICSPRKLQDLCQFEMVSLPRRLESLKLNSLPSDLYPCLITEAILQRQVKSISYLISTWPFTHLHLQKVVPKEEIICNDYLTLSTEGEDGMSLMDSISIGLLSLKPHSRLKCINFTGFMHDRRLCRELLRLPIVWMRPVDRQSGYLHSLLRKTLAISKDKVQRYLNRISCIYANIDLLVCHGHMFGPVTIALDCKLTIDDVPIGLALQGSSPFRYVCQRAWLEVLPDVCLPVSLLNKVLDPRYLTHLEIEDSDVCSEPSRWENILEGLSYLSELQCLSMPNTVHVPLLTSAMSQLSTVLNSLVNLKKLNLASCTLRDSLDTFFASFSRGLTYLNLRDCRLTPSDIGALLGWSGVSTLRELNLSRNNLTSLSSLIASLLIRMEYITCFSVSFCSLTTEDIRYIVRHCMDCSQLKVLCVQSFIPPPHYEVKGILEDCANITTLQKCVVLPEAYAFPGTHISQRAENHHRTVSLCHQYLEQLGRSDIELE
ncbi:leucine-rich repeat-containing protein 14 [Biomphalaria pfeifferi]|uniref:Leucine-rich repeat-containing protein 14 n=1 Tax=Biomphalaria pfeifferi TaxID=112525 RepID=A0AAD8ASW8_BIOPF|nr:leucine-rich repeat-containing protein 14 [Biomphalaria pfeifferi]